MWIIKLIEEKEEVSRQMKKNKNKNKKSGINDRLNQEDEERRKRRLLAPGQV